MHPDLDRVITLQRLDSAAADAQRRLTDEPARTLALEARIESAQQALAAARERLVGNKTARIAIEKDVAMHQGRLSKFRETAMAVKTNQEYHAVQKEIGFAQGEIKALEDQILERMLEADELTAQVKRAEKHLADEQKAVDAERRSIEAEAAEMHKAVEKLAAEREALVRASDPAIMRMYDGVFRKRNGIAVSEARDGVCTICHVRLRPQVFNTILRNDQILQCDHCNRILYYVPKAAAESVTPPAS